VRAKLYLYGISYFDAVLWCRNNGIPILAAKSYRSGPTKWIGKVFYFGSRRVIEEGINREVVRKGSRFYVLVRPSDYELVKLRFGDVVAGWQNDYD
jgi:hypothetical protein